jgi:hypothetical protein
MAKQKDRSEVEHLRGEVKNLKAQVRHLKKELARKQKRQHQYEDLEEREKDLEETLVAEIIEDVSRCPKCAAKLEETNIGVRILVRCESCDYRETKKST